MIELRNVSKKYSNETSALNDISIKIEKGEYVAIMGPSGAGKTTLLNIIGLLDTPTEGSYLLNKENMLVLSDKKKSKKRNEKFGFVVQDFGLISYMTVYKNVRIPLLYSKKSNKKNSKTEVKNILKKLKIEDKIDENVNNLSGGQRQRVAIARALINSPDIILADEPTGALDQKTGIEVMQIFSELNAQGKTIIIVTHDPKVAAMCNRTINVIDGKIVD